MYTFVIIISKLLTRLSSRKRQSSAKEVKVLDAKRFEQTLLKKIRVIRRASIRFNTFRYECAKRGGVRACTKYFARLNSTLAWPSLALFRPPSTVPSRHRTLILPTTIIHPSPRPSRAESLPLARNILFLRPFYRTRARSSTARNRRTDARLRIPPRMDAMIEVSSTIEKRVSPTYRSDRKYERWKVKREMEDGTSDNFLSCCIVSYRKFREKRHEILMAIRSIARACATAWTTCCVSIKRAHLDTSRFHEPRWPYANPRRWTLQRARGEQRRFIPRKRTKEGKQTFFLINLGVVLFQSSTSRSRTWP